MSLKNKLNRLKGDLVPEKDHRIAPIPKTSLKTAEQWKSLKAEPFLFEGQCTWVREVSYPIATQHGRYRFSDLKDCVAAWNETESAHPLSAKNLTFDRLLFFDTETTGLGGGVGNTIFLIGCGWVLDDRVVIRQYFLPSPADEVALYQAFLSDVKDLKNLVTYNGKAFDWPQVKTRHTFLRDRIPNLPAFGHFDLLHAARRLWKDSLESSRLSVVERDILQVERKNDVPGHLVPLYYFEYVKEQNPEIIRGVLEHNEYDILSLITLYTHLSELLLYRKQTTAKEGFEIGRWHEYIGAKQEAMACFKHVSNSKNSETLLAKQHMAGLYKQQKRYQEALDIWTQLASFQANGKPDILIEMAKVYEHQYKDFNSALACSRKAYQITRKRKRMHLCGADEEQSVLKRISRLERKAPFL